MSYRFHLFGKMSNLKINSSLLILYSAGFFLSLTSNFSAYINSSFIENLVSVNVVGWFFVGANIASFFAMIYFPKVIRKIGNLKATKVMILINIISIMGLMMGPSALWLFIFFVSMWTSANLIWINMDIFVESFTENFNTGKTRAVFFTFMNLGWIIAPTIATRLVIGESYYNLVYLGSAILLLVFYFIIKLNEGRVSRVIDFDKLKIKETVVSFWKDLNLRGIYFTSFFLNLFYSIVVVFMPIYLHRTIGFDWTTLGIIFSVMLIPFVLVEIPAGIIADKYLGEKELLFTGFSILTIALVLFFIVKSPSPIIWGFLLFFSRVGAALVEAMRESRFFKIVDAENISYINFLRSSYPLGYLVGSGLGVLILTFYPVQYLFLFLAIIFLYSFYFVYIIKDSK